jgi:hypothetical protein
MVYLRHIHDPVLSSLKMEFLSVVTIRLTLVLTQPLLQRVTCLKDPDKNEWSVKPNFKLHLMPRYCSIHFYSSVLKYRKTFTGAPREKILTNNYKAVTEESQFSP